MGAPHSVLLDSAGRLMVCGEREKAIRTDLKLTYILVFPEALPAGVQVRSVATGRRHNLALGWDGCVYSWGDNEAGELGHGDRNARHSPALVEELEDVRSVAAGSRHSLAATDSGEVFRCARSPHAGIHSRIALRQQLSPPALSPPVPFPSDHTPVGYVLTTTIAQHIRSGATLAPPVLTSFPPSSPLLPAGA